MFVGTVSDLKILLAFLLAGEQVDVWDRSLLQHFIPDVLGLCEEFLFLFGAVIYFKISLS